MPFGSSFAGCGKNPAARVRNTAFYGQIAQNRTLPARFLNICILLCGIPPEGRLPYQLRQRRNQHSCHPCRRTDDSIQPFFNPCKLLPCTSGNKRRCQQTGQYIITHYHIKNWLRPLQITTGLEKTSSPKVQPDSFLQIYMP